MNHQELDGLVTAYGDAFTVIEKTCGRTSFYIDGKVVIYESPREIFSMLVFGRLHIQNLMAANEELRRIIQ